MNRITITIETSAVDTPRVTMTPKYESEVLENSPPNAEGLALTNHTDHPLDDKRLNLIISQLHKAVRARIEETVSDDVGWRDDWDVLSVNVDLGQEIDARVRNEWLEHLTRIVERYL